MRHDRHQLPTPYGAPQDLPALAVNAVQRKHILCQIDSDGSNVVHGLPLLSEIDMTHLNLGTSMPLRDGEVPYIRWAA